MKNVKKLSRNKCPKIPAATSVFVHMDKNFQKNVNYFKLVWSDGESRAFRK